MRQTSELSYQVPTPHLNRLHDLDKLVVATVERARPLPRVPDAQSGLTLDAQGLRKLQQMRVLERVAQRCHDAKVQLMVLKGAALGLTLYGDLNDRAMDDVDLLVHPEDFDRTCELLRELGATREEPLVRDDFCPRFHYEVGFVIGSIFPVRIDLHVRPFRPMRYAKTVPPDAFWGQARSVTVGHAPILVPGTNDMILHLATHAAVHGFSRRLWIQDISHWALEFRDKIDWDTVIAAAHRWGLVHPLHKALERTTDELAAPCSEGARYVLSCLRVSWRDRLALWQAPRDAQHPVSHVLVNLLCTPGWRTNAAYLWTMLIPSRQHMQTWYAGRHRFWYPVSQVARWCRAIKRALVG